MKTKPYLFTILGLAAIASLRAAEPTPATSPAVDPCLSVHKHVSTLLAEDPGRILEIVSGQVTANNSCSCEVVKAAIPVAPDANPEAQAVLACLDPNRGEDAGKSARDSIDAKVVIEEVAQVANPLNPSIIDPLVVQEVAQ